MGGGVGVGAHPRPTRDPSLPRAGREAPCLGGEGLSFWKRPRERDVRVRAPGTTEAQAPAKMANTLGTLKLKTGKGVLPAARVLVVPSPRFRVPVTVHPAGKETVA